jgi:fluoride ion exporter CrcB/FEX
MAWLYLGTTTPVAREDRMSADLLLLSVALGSLGAVVRYGVQSWSAVNGSARLGILIVNVAGSALAGGLVALPSSFATAAILAGFCGGLTTLSTMVIHLLPVPGAPPLRTRLGLALAHVLGSVGAALVAYSAVAWWLMN